MLTHVEMLTRIAVGAVMGAMIGYERSQQGRPLGLRTHMIVALASATFMVCSTQFASYQGYPADGGMIEADPSRIASNIVSGVGFIAGGSILREGVHVQGLTTAAALWLVSAIGMSAGGGMYVEAGFATGLGLIALRVVRRLEDKREFPVRGKVVVTRREALEPLVNTIERSGAIVISVESAAVNEQLRVTVCFELKHSTKNGIVPVVHELEQQPAVYSVHVERLS